MSTPSVLRIGFTSGSKVHAVRDDAQVPGRPRYGRHAVALCGLVVMVGVTKFDVEADAGHLCKNCSSYLRKKTT